MEDVQSPKISGECTQQDGTEAEFENDTLTETLERLKPQEEESRETMLKFEKDDVYNYDSYDDFSPCRNKYRIGSIYGHKSIGNDSESKGAYDKESEPHLLCKEKDSEFSYFDWNEPERHDVGAGLSNMGNTCFLNAIMQCFIHSVPFVQALLSLKHEHYGGNNAFCLLCAVLDQIEHSLVYAGQVISPSNLVNNLSSISSFFRRYQQEDGHEFLQCLLDKLDSSLSRYEMDADGSSSSGDSLVKQIYGGRIVSQLHCSNCGHNSYSYEPLNDLSLGIDDVDNLESALRSFTKVETIEDTEKFTCESCKEQVIGEKQLMLDQAPSVATLHLKRFKSYGYYVEKIAKNVDYPLELDLKPHMRDANNITDELKYDLYAVVVHVGPSSTSGHYFCYIRTSPDTWHRFDDSKVTRVSEETALSQDAYILFYARKGTTWFSSMFEEWKASSERKISNTSPKSVLDDMDIPSTSKNCGMGLNNCEAVEATNVAEGTITESSVGLTNDAVQSMVKTDIQDSTPTDKISPVSSKPYHDVGHFDGADFVTELGHAAYVLEPNSRDEASRTSPQACCSSHVENIIDNEVKQDDINPSTPPRSQSPGIYSDEEPAEEAYSIPVGHLKGEDKAALTAKMAMDKANHDLKRKEAAKYMSKSMPTGRRQMLMTAMMGGSRSENSSLNKKRRQASISNSSPSSNSKKRAKLSLKRVLRPVVA